MKVCYEIFLWLHSGTVENLQRKKHEKIINKTATVDENIIATIKMRNKFCYPLKVAIFPILR